MDISRWPLSRVMQLPDHVFGSQLCISEYVGTNAAVESYFKMRHELPDWFVVWSILVEAEKHSAATWVNVSLRLGGAATVPADFKNLDRLIGGKGSEEQTYDWHLPAVGLKHITGLRHLVNGKGRHIIGLIKMVAETGTVENMVSVFYTPIPREAPDWLVGAR